MTTRFSYQSALLAILLIVATGCNQQPIGQTTSSSETDTGTDEQLDSEIEGTLDPAAAHEDDAQSSQFSPGLPKEPEPLDKSSPEFAVVQFLVAMNAKDEGKLRQYTVPTDDFEWLLKGDKAAELTLSHLEKEFTRNVRALAAGDEVTYRNEKTVITPEEVSGDRAAIIMPGAPMPFHCVKIDGQWKVDASEIIKGRQAMSQEREQEAAGDPQQVEP